jgi:hypothetical protein
MAYPARADEVIAIDAADGLGSHSKFNSAQSGKQLMFTALGEAVKSAYSMNLSSDEDEPGWKRMDGTSCATPIAAAIAGLILEFSRPPPLCYDASVELHLKLVARMREVLQEVFTAETRGHTLYHHLNPCKIFRITERFPTGGE